MTREEALGYAQEAMFIILELSLPLLIVTLVVGTLVSIVQTVTQIQEQTLTFIPKIVVAFMVLAVIGGWMLQVAVAFATRMFLEISA
jgi:flagellar biosynthetic protein FliQ